ncbi:MAG: PQQ-binding-like beta-propeller repeat protein [Planctomycetota bacterium]
MFGLSCILLFALGQSDTPSQNWPQWRGPAGNSVAATKALPTSWSATENVVWKAPLPGWGNSTPAIWDDAIYVTTQVDDARLLLLRLDRAKGTVVWQKEVGTGSPRRKGPVGNLRFHDEHNMATPSPVTDGKHVWVTFGNGAIACYAADGAKVWDLDLLKDYGPLSIWWGHGSSPVIYKDLLITNVIQDPAGSGPSYVVAHDKLTGKKKWLTPRVTGAKGEPGDSYTTPLLHTHDGQTDLIIFGGNVLDAYNPDDGALLWSYKGVQGNRVISGPTLVGDTVVAVEGMKGPVFAVKAGGKGDVTKSNLLWKTKTKGSNPDASTPVVAHGLIFMASNNGVAYCLDAATGEELWKERLGAEIRASPLVAGDRVYFLAKDGKASIVAAAREYKLIGQPELDEEVIASPAVAGDDLYVRTKKNLYRIGKR